MLARVTFTIVSFSLQTNFVSSLLITKTTYRSNYFNQNSAIDFRATKNDGFNDLKLDESQLSDQEKDRIAFIQKLTLEADEMIKNAGINSENIEEEGIYVEVKDTQWSGQSDVEMSRKSENNFQDLVDRWGLAVGDVTAFLLFAAIGRSNHAEEVDVAQTVLTALPFLVSWLLVSPWLGAYSRQATSSISAIPLGVAPSLAVGTISGLAMRGAIKGYVPPVVFSVLAFVFPFVLICISRVTYLKLFGATSDEKEKDAGALEVFKMIGTLIRRW